MAKCDRSGTVYRRHQYKDGRCKRCGTLQADQLKALAKRREERKAARIGGRLENLIVTG